MTPFLTKLADYGVDVDVTLERFVGDEKLYITCLKMLLAEPSFGQLGEAIAAKDYEAAFAAAHALKGVVGNLGLTPMFEQVNVVVEALRTEQHDGLDAHYAKVMEHYDRVSALI